VAKVRKKTEEIQIFIVSKVSEYPSDIVAFTSAKFDISRQASARHVRRLVDEGVLETTGVTRNMEV